MNSARTLTTGLGIIALAAVTLTILLPCRSMANDESAAIGDVLVQGVAARPAKGGETVRITFSVENTGIDRVIVTGVNWPTGEFGRVMGLLGTTRSAAIDGFPIAPGETALFDGKTTWIEVGPLKADLTPESIVQARLVFASFEAALPVHVTSGGNKNASVIVHSAGSKQWWRLSC
jgi:hypothetical protein